MICEAVREACSARHDGEAAEPAGEPRGWPAEPGGGAAAPDPGAVHAHLASCRDCAAYAGALAALDGRLRREALAAIPDTSAALIERLAYAGRAGWARRAGRAGRARRLPLPARAAAVLLVLAAVPVGAIAGTTHTVVHPSHQVTPCTARLFGGPTAALSAAPARSPRS